MSYNTLLNVRKLIEKSDTLPMPRKNIPWFMDKKKEKSNADVPEKWNIMFKDASKEGRKHGFERANQEFEEQYDKILELYIETKILFSQEVQNKNEKLDHLTQKLQEIKFLIEKLSMEVSEKSNDIAEKNNISAELIKKSLGFKSSFGILSIMYPNPYPRDFDPTDIIYNYKLKNWKKAELEGYQEARQIHRKKIVQLQEKIIETLLQITEEQTKIAELKILLK